MRKPFLAWLAACGLLLTCSAWAHAPYERVVGTFHRGDGQEVTIVKAYLDGVFSADPESIQFRLTNNVRIDGTQYGPETVVWPVNNGIELYTYARSWLPVATQIRRFDGYSISEAGTAGKRILSFWVHLLDKWFFYVLALTGAAFLRLCAAQTSKIPKKELWILARGLWIAAVCILTAAYTFLILYSTLSPLLLAIAGTAMYFIWRRLWAW